MGSPDAEARFDAAIAKAKEQDANARDYPMLYVRLLVRSSMLMTESVNRPSTARRCGIGTQ
jgi:hypothetical protein